MTDMKKIAKKKIIKYKIDDLPLSVANESDTAWISTPSYIAKLKDFTFNEFKKIADKTPFTQAEWAAIMHVSERTLQRYAKSNGVFAAINAERALQIQKIVKEGIQTFGNVNMFYNWIKGKPYMLEGNLSFESLTTNEGIQRVFTQLGRIQHGILA